MKKFHIFYLIYALFLFAVFVKAEYYGWSFTNVDEVKNVPKSVRDNPGSYRAHYRSSARYFGGK